MTDTAASCPPTQTGAATIVGCYRYRLERSWKSPSVRTVTWVMLNPSTADATENDATIRKCTGFAKLWGCNSLVVVNLFALRSRDPKALRDHPDPVGPLNDLYIGDAVSGSDLTVVAWGQGWPKWAAPRVAKVGQMLHERALQIGLTKSGQPVHPLMQPYSAPRNVWRSL